MKNLYRLINFEFGIICKFMLGISILLISGQNLLLYLAGRDYFSGRYIPFEKLISISGLPVLFYICLGLVLACCIYGVLANYMGSKSVYTLMTLPQSRGSVFMAKAAADAIGLLMLVAAQFVSIFIGYLLFSSSIPSAENGEIVLEKPVNGLFLAFVRSDFLRILFPLNMESFISTLSILISVLLAVFFIIFCLQSGKYLNIGFAILNIVLVIYIITCRANAMIGWREPNLYLYSLILAGLCIYYIRQSMRWIARGTVMG